MDSVPATMKSRTRQLIKKLKANKDIIGHLNVPESIVRNENRLGLVREYKTKGISEGVPKLTTPLTRVQAAKKKKRRDVMSSPYKWLK